MFEKPEGYIAPKTVPVLYSEAEIGATLARLAGEIRRDLGEEFALVALLKGSFVFTADLIRALYAESCAPLIDFMAISSYGKGKIGAESLIMGQKLTEEVAGRPVLLVDDILESGRTLDLARKEILGRGAREVKICALLEKPGKRRVEIDADFVGFVIPDRFVVGYGLDYASYYRELPFIGALD